METHVSLVAVRRALVSVWDKSDLTEFASRLVAAGAVAALVLPLLLLVMRAHY